MFYRFESLLFQQLQGSSIAHWFLQKLMKRSEDEQPQEGSIAPNDFEPNQEDVLDDLLPRNLTTQIFASLLDSASGEQLARMTAMDNATRNAGDLIDRLTTGV